jgi:hypothetical protein
MLMHSCCHILFIVLIDLIQSSKEIQKHLKLDLENQIRKRKLLFLSLPLSAQSACWPFSWPARDFPLPSLPFRALAGPAHGRRNRRRVVLSPSFR